MAQTPENERRGRGQRGTRGRPSQHGLYLGAIAAAATWLPVPSLQQLKGAMWRRQVIRKGIVITATMTRRTAPQPALSKLIILANEQQAG